MSQGLCRLGAELGHFEDRLEREEVTRADRRQGLTSQDQGGAKANSGRASLLPVKLGVRLVLSQALGQT